MELSTAIELIQNEYLPPPTPAVWCDLGCGSGLFTFALAHLLNAGSTIYAGFTSVEKIGERKSVYGRANLYAAWVS